jgi:threonine dehydratase
VPDEVIVAGMRQLWEVLKIVVEPSGAVPYAALLARRAELHGRRIGIVLSGGNVDLDQLPWGVPGPGVAPPALEVTRARE